MKKAKHFGLSLSKKKSIISHEKVKKQTNVRKQIVAIKKLKNKHPLTLYILSIYLGLMPNTPLYRQPSFAFEGGEHIVKVYMEDNMAS